MKSSEEIKKLLQAKPEFRSKLYARGFLATNADVDTAEHPFYGLWKECSCAGFKVLCAPGQKAFAKEQENGNALVLIGHAYNPFTGESEEQDIVGKLLAKLAENRKEFFDYLNQLTGIFTICWLENGVFSVVGDASCIQTTFYARKDSAFYVSSHTNLLGELLNLEWDEYIKELVGYKFFKLLGNSLPGDLTQFAEVKRLVPNHYISFSKGIWNHVRFFAPKKLSLAFDETAGKVSEILHESMGMVARKWDKPAISMTGGCDSKTTLACATGLYDKFSYFSYTSSESETVDADAAHELCNMLKLPHRIYAISQNDSDYPEIETVRKLLWWNCGAIRQSNSNDVRKRIVFMDTQDFDVEVKSWCSEIGRAYYSKRFNGRTNFGKVPTPRVCTTLYKFFLHNRALVRKTDEVFKKYLEQFFEQDKNNPVEWQEQFFWEFRVPSWNGLVITGEHRFSFDITIPYNNRILLELLMNVNIQDRIKDTLYTAIREKMNPVINSHKIVTNLKHTHNRECLENLYYVMNTRLI